ncbi:MAG: hypothetical protein BMS9Abin09_0853 [Gammaproteobacteria bacterium]|nr:MAG: hypothetical protein BMS9Abin09_0853 [Gammaproteobacteria bacterium]
MISKKWPVLAGFCVALLLAGCQQTGSRQGFYASPLLPGDEVEVLQAIMIPSGMARIYLQHGKTMSYDSTDQYAPFCYFLLRDPLPAEQQIKPGILVVDSVWLDETSVSFERPVRVAAVGMVAGSSYSPIAYQFHISLRSQQQVPVMLVCSGAFNSPSSAQPIRLPQVREVLGDYAEVRVKAPATGQ